MCVDFGRFYVISSSSYFRYDIVLKKKKNLEQPAFLLLPFDAP